MGTEKQQSGGDRSEFSRELIEQWPSVEGAAAMRRLLLMQVMQRDMNHTIMNLEQIDALLAWKLDKRIAAAAAAKKGIKMQDQITIELRVDFADKDKIPELVKIACSMARTLVANVQLLGPTCKPECVVFTDNFMSGAEKVDIYADLIGAGKEQLAAVKARDLVFSGAATAPVTGEDTVSSELLNAMKD